MPKDMDATKDAFAHFRQAPMYVLRSETEPLGTAVEGSLRAKGHVFMILGSNLRRSQDQNVRAHGLRAVVGSNREDLHPRLLFRRSLSGDGIWVTCGGVYRFVPPFAEQ